MRTTVGIIGAGPAGLPVSERTFPFGRPGILADVPPSHDGPVHARHERRFALLSLRTPAVSGLPRPARVPRWSNRSKRMISCRFRAGTGSVMVRPLVVRGIAGPRSVLRSKTRERSSPSIRVNPLPTYYS